MNIHPTNAYLQAMDTDATPPRRPPALSTESFAAKLRQAAAPEPARELFEPRPVRESARPDPARPNVTRGALVDITV